MKVTEYYIDDRDVLDGTLKTVDGDQSVYGTSSKYGKAGRVKSSTIWTLNPERRQRWQLAGVQWNSKSPVTISFLRSQMNLDAFLTPGSGYVCFSAIIYAFSFAHTLFLQVRLVCSHWFAFLLGL